MMESEQANNNDDVMYRRLKNRERQRRYRARKRLEADKKKAGGTVANTSSPPVPLLVEMKVEHFEANKEACNALKEVSNNYVTRVHCRRDWKKDARMAHKMKEGVNSLNAVVSGSADFSPMESGHSNNSERSIQPGRRRWKEDARNRNTEVVTGESV